MNCKQLMYALFFVVVVLCLGCSREKADTGNEQAADQRQWPEMDQYHEVMAETFHPYKDSADLGPTKSRVGELVAAANKWVEAPLPKKVDNDQMKEKLQELKQETETLATQVQAGDEKVIGEQLTKVHDLFHQIQELWYGGGHGHDHEHEH